ncbi:MAG: protein translocase subunit SecD, partial [Actinocrinis sp.]
ALGTAVSIMSKRVNAFGVSEAQVSQQGSNTIQVEIPGHNSQALVDQIGQTALLYFRPVLTSAAATTMTTKPTATPGPTSSASPAATGSASAKASSSASTPSATAKASGQAQKLTTLHDAAGSASPNASANASGSPAASNSAAASPTPTPTSAADAAATASESKAQAAFTALNCVNKTSTKAASEALPTDYIASCDKDNTAKYLLGPSLVSGTDVTSASAVPVTVSGTPTGSWQINLTFDAKGTSEFSTATQALFNESQSGKGSGQFAIVLDGVVESAPTVQSAITGGQAQITGSFSQSQSDDLATILNYGALPLKFDVSQVSIVSPTLGGHELSGGLLAGAVGLALVFLYVIFYYRGLAAIAISSLATAAALTYAFAVLLGPLMGFTLSLAGVAGLIVAIGITADSFVVFFERLRDEVREGRTLRTAVEHGWTRARRTIVASDFVSFLAAAVLYLMSIGSVKGFAFTLGLTTVIDIVVVFLFTKPLITLAARSEFFGGGHKWSGLDPERLGGTRVAPRGATAAGGKRMTIAERRKAAEQAAAQDAEGGVQSDDTKRVDV